MNSIPLNKEILGENANCPNNANNITTKAKTTTKDKTTQTPTTQATATTQEATTTQTPTTTLAPTITKQAIITAPIVLTTTINRRRDKKSPDGDGGSDGSGGQGESTNCYECGLNSVDFPDLPTCSQIFSPIDHTYFYLRRKVKCEQKNLYKGNRFYHISYLLYFILLRW